MWVEWSWVAEGGSCCGGESKEGLGRSLSFPSLQLKSGARTQARLDPSVFRTTIIVIVERREKNSFVQICNQDLVGLWALPWARRASVNPGGISPCLLFPLKPCPWIFTLICSTQPCNKQCASWTWSVSTSSCYAVMRNLLVHLPSLTRRHSYKLHAIYLPPSPVSLSYESGASLFQLWCLFVFSPFSYTFYELISRRSSHDKFCTSTLIALFQQ